MFLDFSRRRTLMLWQFLFVLLSTTWLWAPHINHVLSTRTTLISYYEASPQVLGWAFRACDILGAVLLLLITRYLSKQLPTKRVAIFLYVIAAGSAIDAVFATTCQVQSGRCVEAPSVFFLVHAIESAITWGTLAALAVYDIHHRKRWISIAFLGVQLVYGFLYITTIADRTGFATLSQFIYESSLVVWIAWLCRELCARPFRPTKRERKVAKKLIAAWAFANGILAIVISLAHIHLLGKIKAFYFAGDNAWLAQHGVIVGVVMLYLSRHLARGEMRARHIFLVLTAVETIKYSVITPHPVLMMLYGLTFLGLFIFRDDFDRGTLPLTWSGRLKDLYVMTTGLLAASVTALILLDRDSKVSVITGRAFSHFFTYVGSNPPVRHSSVRSVLLAHTISAFLAASLASILWILFKPSRQKPQSFSDQQDIEKTLRQYSYSSEDFFKLWPEDKHYFHGTQSDGFIAYKLAGSIAFALADPIGNRPADLLNEFRQWCKARRFTVCLLPVYEHNLPLYTQAKFETFHIGSSAVITIDTFLRQTANGKWWRWQKNRAQKSGYEYAQSLPPHSDAFLQSLQEVSDQWLTTGGHVERGFSLGYFDHAYMQQCPIHYLKSADGTVVAFTNQLPQFTANSTVTIDLLRYRPENNNTMPYLLYNTIAAIAEVEPDKRYFDLGFVPFAKTEGPLLVVAKTLSSGRFSAKGLEQFKNKFEPTWQPNYLAYDGDVLDLAAIALNLERVMKID